MRAPRRAFATGLAILGCALPSSARAASFASIQPSFLPDRLGADTKLTLALRFSGGEQGVPAPLRTSVLELPAGMVIDLGRVGGCPAGALQRRGAAGCPAAALLGRGHAVLEVHAGSQTIPEQAALSVFRGPNRGSHPTLEILSQGSTPLDERTVSIALLAPDSAPYGSELTVATPPIPTLVYEPDASFVSLSLTIGRAGAITVPRSCPAGGFPFAGTFDFADGSTASAQAVVRCP
jgi:hypothetical protein